jgi:hypothetical protein
MGTSVDSRTSEIIVSNDTDGLLAEAKRLIEEAMRRCEIASGGRDGRVVALDNAIGSLSEVRETL